MADQSKKKWAYTTRPLATSMCTPAVRTVSVHLWIDENDVAQDDIYPVLALRSVIERVYCKGYEGERVPDEALSEKELIQAGWWLDGQREETHAVILFDGVLVDADDPSTECINGVTRLVVCTWTPEEDEKLLAEERYVLEKDARAKVAAKLRRIKPVDG